MKVVVERNRSKLLDKREASSCEVLAAAGGSVPHSTLTASLAASRRGPGVSLPDQHARSYFNVPSAISLRVRVRKDKRANSAVSQVVVG